MAFGDRKGAWTFTANSIVANNQATLSTGSSTVAVNDLIVVVIAEQTGNTSSGASDTLGNTYSALTAGTLAASTVSGRAFWARVTTAGTNTNVNVAATASANNVAIVAACYEGPFASSPLDANPANNNNTDNTSPFTCPATGTLAQADELVACWMVKNSNATLSATSPLLKDVEAVTQTVASATLGTKVVSATTTTSPEFTGTNPTASVQGTASFKKSSAVANNKTLNVSQGQAQTVQRAAGKRNVLTQGQNVSGLGVANLILTAITGAGTGQLVTLAREYVQGGANNKIITALFGQDVSGVALATVAVASQSGAGQSQTVSLVALRAFNKLISVAQAQAVTLRRSLAKIVNVLQSQAIIVRRAMASRITIAQPELIFVFKGSGRRITVTQPQSVTLTRLKSFGKLISLVTQAQAVTVRRSLAKLVTVLQSQAVTLRRAMARRVTLTQAQAVTVVRATGHRVLITMAQAVTVTRQFIAGGGGVTPKIISLTQAQVITVRRALAKRINVLQSMDVSGFGAALLSLAAQTGAGLAQVVTLTKQFVGSGGGVTSKIILLTQSLDHRLTAAVHLIRSFSGAGLHNEVSGVALALKPQLAQTGSGLQQVITLTKTAGGNIVAKVISWAQSLDHRLTAEVHLIRSFVGNGLHNVVSLVAFKPGAQKIISAAMALVASGFGRAIFPLTATTGNPEQQIVTVVANKLTGGAAKVINVVTGQAVRLVAGIRKIITLTTTNVVTLFKVASTAGGKTIVVFTSQAVRLQAGINKRITLTMAQAVTLLRTTGHRIVASLAQAVTVVRSLAKNRILNITQAQLVTLRRGSGKLVTVTMAQLVTLRTAIARCIIITMAQAVALYRGVAKRITLTMAQAVTVVRSFAKGAVINVVQAQAITLRRSYGKFIQILQAQFVRIARVSAVKVIVVVMAQSIAVIRGMSRKIIVRPLVQVWTVSTPLFATIYKTIMVGMGQAVTLIYQAFVRPLRKPTPDRPGGAITRRMQHTDKRPDQVNDKRPTQP